VAGAYIKKLLQQSKSRIYPVDSEHSAIYQCLVGETPESVKQLIITASGGPFRTWDKDKIAKATAADALRHPNWSMGAKITIDSATMLNKAFEIIEARWLFNITPDRITAVVHPQSIVHSMVEFVDGAIKAQLGIPDMHLPIAYALGEGSRIAAAEPPLTLDRYANMTFEQPDIDKFPCLGFAHEALERGGNTACVINAANEIAVAAFLKDRIAFGDIYRIIRKSVDSLAFIAEPTYADYVATNAEARKFAESLL
jgi:1-deoxy-D-xylulose-5-phosphate reductoisomerase